MNPILITALEALILAINAPGLVWTGQVLRSVLEAQDVIEARGVNGARRLIAAANVRVARVIFVAQFVVEFVVGFILVRRLGGVFPPAMMLILSIGNLLLVILLASALAYWSWRTVRNIPLLRDLVAMQHDDRP
jgi:hypothetical protein